MATRTKFVAVQGFIRVEYETEVLSCFCSFYPCGHTHSAMDTKISRQRFLSAGPPTHKRGSGSTLQG